MELFLMALCVTMFGLAVCALAFSAATRDEQARPEVVVEERPVLAPARFFASDVASDAAVPAPSTRVPIEVLLLQIERHVRLEQAAAESFLEAPTLQSLHSPTMSPLVH